MIDFVTSVGRITTIANTWIKTYTGHFILYTMPVKCTVYPIEQFYSPIVLMT